MSDHELLLGVAILIVIGVTVAGIYLLPERRVPPHLIDLHDYEAQLLDERDRGHKMLMPPPMPPGLVMGRWAEGAEEAMRRNHRLARAIYERVSRGD